MDDPRTAALTWLTRAEFEALGFGAIAPETDYGMGWGEHQQIRVSFAPTQSDGAGVLFAHDRHTNQYAVLSEATTRDAVERAWDAVPNTEHGYLDLADRVNAEGRLSRTDALALWEHCVRAEVAARHAHESADLEAPDRFELAHRVVLSRAARVATEDLLLSALQPADCEFGAPVIVRYRVLERPDWTGRVIGTDLTDAAFRAADLRQLAGPSGFEVQATSLRHGHVAVAASRVPELAFATGPINASSIPF